MTEILAHMIETIEAEVKEDVASQVEGMPHTEVTHISNN